ncbi:brefeldin A-inhibited guanine nucleotide-exchange protein 3 isoform X3 [Syngnathoides biaculeatus]|uniref:brefeldin A-inhibited guanine nucleotide-exchange protein 3 isoform X3 n=1 Tax=Syngnathoides biaculeatus TaxID=300417 RepID=UPI002ADD7276|nr:brefeldin A-inhibited guanine nucleotide-exchange protein 3 isoform X3 [Syngnathoides biaculeatus]
MEEVLRRLHKDAAGHKHKSLRDACVLASESLEARNGSAGLSSAELRARCLLPLQMALESKNVKLGQTALGGMQKLLCEDRFVGGAGEEAEPVDNQLVSQVLAAVRVTPALHEDLQVEVMKVLLCVTYSPNFDINGDSVLRISQVCMETYARNCRQRSINTAVRATLSQILGDLTLRLRHRQEEADGEEPAAPPLQGKDVSPTSQALCDDVVTVLTFFCDKLESVDFDEQLLQLLYLESILSVLSSCPPTMHLSRRFTDLVWKQLCPSLVAIMGNPLNDITVGSHHGHTGATEAERLCPGAAQEAEAVSDRGRGSGCSSGAPARIAPVVRSVCYVAAELVRLVSCVESMKPVLQSLYHRILLYPPPQHRTEAIRITKEILGSPQRLFDLAGPSLVEPDGRKRSFSKRKSYLDLLRLVMDGMMQACAKGGVEACYWSVSCACALLRALEELSKGRGLTPEQVRLLAGRLDELKDGAGSSRASVEVNEADFLWQRRILSSRGAPRDASPSGATVERGPDVSVSISVTADTGRTVLEEEARPRQEGGDGKEAVPPDVVQRSHALPYPDVTNFLSVECRSRTAQVPASRYSDSNFSVEEQDLSRTDLDSCEQYSMAAEKDSGRSDVSDAGSDDAPPVDDDDERSPSDALARRSMRAAAALSLKLLCHQEADQHGARLFVRSLAALLPQLLALDDDAAAAELDRRVQNFSSDFCSRLQAGGLPSPGVGAGLPLSCQSLLNADGVYLLSFYALLLNLKLRNCNFYHQGAPPPALGLKDFVTVIQSSGVLVVLSPAWIEEVYRQVLERDLLAQAGYWAAPDDKAAPLIAALTDIDGLGSSAVGGQLMGRFGRPAPSRERATGDAVAAGAVFSRFLLTGVWSELTEVLSAPLTGRVAAGSGTSPLFAREQSQRERDAVCLSLDGLRQAAALSCALGVAANCASALAQMATASCVRDERDDGEGPEAGDAVTQAKQRLEQRSRPAGVRLHAAHVLCMDAILNVALEMGSHNGDCWTHVFRVSEYVSSLEHAHFSDPSSHAFARRRQQEAPPDPDGLARAEADAPDAGPPPTVRELLAQDLKGGTLLTGSGAAEAVCALSTQADRLFEDACVKLNLASLVAFLQQLRKASQRQLFHAVADTGDYSLATPGEAKWTWARRSSLHLFRLGEAALRIVRNPDRPLLHKMRAWSVVAPHLVEAACHKERHVSQKAVSFIHDVLTEVLSGWTEPPHFRFNEALFRPFEHIMQLELCDDDVQDQVVTSIGELVEMCSPRILSGWRPLFSALRTAHGGKMEAGDSALAECRLGERPAPVFDVFEAFIGTDDIQVFANAATDYIMCLMKFVKGLGEADFKETSDCATAASRESVDLCRPALGYLRRCSQLLANIYKMPSKPVFQGGRLASLPVRSRELSAAGEDALDGVLRDLDDDTGLIQVWILLLEQLATAVSDCPRRHQPPTLDLLFLLLREIAVVPGPGFAIFAVVRLLLPVMSLWLQRSHGDHAYWDAAAAANFKHAVGLCCELVVEHVDTFMRADGACEFWMDAMLKELFGLLVSCVSQPAEAVSRVGCSCIRSHAHTQANGKPVLPLALTRRWRVGRRYVLVSGGPVFTEEMWRLACCALRDAFSATLQPVKKLVSCFQSGSDSFCGDACEVKVAAPSPSASAEAESWRIRAMAQQVFTLDSQRPPKTPNPKDGLELAPSCLLIMEPPHERQARSSYRRKRARSLAPAYSLTVWSACAGRGSARIPFRNVVVSLLSHQVLLQNLSHILLEEFVKQPDSQGKATPVTSEPARPAAGFLRYVSTANLSIILDLLLDSYRTACDFDTRPGLKYLLMKVSGVRAAANLYRQAAVSFDLYAQALLGAISAQADAVTAQQVKKILGEEDDGSSDSSGPGSASSEDEDIFEETAQVAPFSFCFSGSRQSKSAICKEKREEAPVRVSDGELTRLPYPNAHAGEPAPRSRQAPPVASGGSGVPERRAGLGVAGDASSQVERGRVRRLRPDASRPGGGGGGRRDAPSGRRPPRPLPAALAVTLVRGRVGGGPHALGRRRGRGSPGPWRRVVVVGGHARPESRIQLRRKPPSQLPGRREGLVGERRQQAGLHGDRKEPGEAGEPIQTQEAAAGRQTPPARAAEPARPQTLAQRRRRGPPVQIGLGRRLPRERRHGGRARADPGVEQHGGDAAEWSPAPPGPDLPVSSAGALPEPVPAELPRRRRPRAPGPARLAGSRGKAVRHRGVTPTSGVMRSWLVCRY